MPQKKRNAIRLTVPMDPDVHAVFKRMAEAAKIPIGRAIAEWCTDTVDGAQFVAAKMEEARRQPQLVMREMEAMAGGLLDSIRQTSRDVSDKRAGRGGAPAHPRPGTKP